MAFTTDGLTYYQALSFLPNTFHSGLAFADTPILYKEVERPIFIGPNVLDGRFSVQTELATYYNVAGRLLEDKSPLLKELRDEATIGVVKYDILNNGSDIMKLLAFLRQTGMNLTLMDLGIPLGSPAKYTRPSIGILQANPLKGAVLHNYDADTRVFFPVVHKTPGALNFLVGAK